MIAPSFADIFYNNCCKNGVLPVVLPPTSVDELFARLYECEGYRLVVDLERQQVRLPEGRVFAFSIADYRRRCLLEGLDDIGVTLRSAGAIRAYESARARSAPWLFPERGAC